MVRRVAFSAVFLALCLTAGAVRAQATRTWVSGVGDDANPCSRTAPCRTFAGAIPKTAAHGEIDVLDPGDFGRVTITKSIVIDGAGPGVGKTGFYSGNGITINAASTDVVTIRNLDMDAGASDAIGINFLAGGTLHVENVRIRNSDPASTTAMGIDFQPTANTTKLFVSRISIQKMQGGIKIEPSGSATVVATIEDSFLNGNATFGMRVQGNSSVVATNVTADGNLNGFYITDTTNQNPVLSLESCVSANNSIAGVRAGFAGLGLATIYLSNTQVFENANGLQRDANGQIISFGNNKSFGNTVAGAPSSTIPQD